MLPTMLRLLKQKNRPQTAFCLVRSLATKTTPPTTCATRNRKPLLMVLSRRPQQAIVINSVVTQQRQFSLWNIPISLMAASPMKRRLALAALGGTGLAVAIVLGPFLLVGLGGIAAVMGFRIWRLKKDIQRQLQHTGQQTLQDWPDFLNAFMQQQGTGVFGKDQRQVQTEAMRRLELWAHTSRGRNQLIEYGIHPERITQNVSMRGSSYASSTSSNVTGTTRQIKIELDLRNSPGAVLIASAQLDKESNNLTINDIKVITAAGHVISVPLSVNQQSPGGGRVIEGEFYDV